MTTEEEINKEYKDTVDATEAPRFPNATYFGKASLGDRNGYSEPLYGKSGRAWRDERWIRAEGINEDPDQRGPRLRWFFLPEQQARKDKNIFIVYEGNLQFS
jgi:hypothetical protein